jgi:hypothetical protein
MKRTNIKKQRNPISLYKDMLSIKRISDLYGFHPQTIYRWLAKHDLEAEKHGRGGKLFIRKDYLEDFIRTWYENASDIIAEAKRRDTELSESQHADGGSKQSMLAAIDSIRRGRMNKQSYLNCEICHNRLTLTKDEFEMENWNETWLCSEYRCDNCKQNWRMMANKRLIESDDELGIIGMMVRT